MGFARRSRKCSNKTRSTDIYSCSAASALRPQWPGDSLQAIRESKYRWPSRDTLSLEISQQELSLLPDGVDFTRLRRLPVFHAHAALTALANSLPWLTTAQSWHTQSESVTF
jgi:hypothetical protein